jgi:hypothetical protein
VPARLDIRRTDESFLKVMDSDGKDLTTGDAELSFDPAR